MIRKPRQLFRLIYISMVLARYGLDEILVSIHLFAPLRFLTYLNPWNWRSTHRLPRGVRLRLALEQLGPIFVKFGQALSTRRDLLPEDIADELEKLQDQVPPFSGEEAQQLVEQNYGQPLSALFESFELMPLASASIAQVHAARLWDGKEVVVKVLRPRIHNIIRRDVDLMYTVAKFAQRYWADSKRYRPKEVVQEFDRTIFHELDLVREAANASQLRRNFLGSPLMYVPEVYWPYARENVIVMERVHGVPIANLNELKRRHVNMKKLAEQGVEIFFTQVFRDSFFHADMHPGNIFVRCTDPENPQYIAVDFGIMGTLNAKDQRYLAENLLAFFKRDYRRVAELHVESGWVPANIRVDEFESAIRAVSEPAFERPLKEISIGQMMLRLFQTAKRFHLEVQPQLVLLQKTLINVEGLGRQLYPDLDLWSTAKPFLEQWLKTQLGPGVFLRKLWARAPYWADKLPEIPDLLYDLLEKARTEKEVPHHRAAREMEVLRYARLRGFLTGIMTVLVIGLVVYVVKMR